MNLEGSPAILKTRDLAILLDLSPDTVNDMARRGILKGYKSGNQWRFRRKGHRAVFREGKNSPPRPADRPRSSRLTSPAIPPPASIPSPAARPPRSGRESFWTRRGSCSRPPSPA